MKQKKRKYPRLLAFIDRYVVFFLLIAFIVTCCLELFLTTMGLSLGIHYSAEHISIAAKLTFCNILILSLIAVVADSIRRRYTVDRPVKTITEAARRMMRGDFSVRIQPVSGSAAEEQWGEIIRCLNQMAEELAGHETLQNDFMAGVSHEMKTPLAVMHSYGTLLQQPDLPQETRIEYAKTITESARRLADLTTNILRLSKLENQQIFPEQKPFDLGEQLCECLLQFEQIWEEKAILIETDLEDEVIVLGDPEMMSLVWNNLFSNAIKFTEKGGTVSLALRTENGRAIVQVSDTGCGISKEVGAHIFEKFYQGDRSRATHGNGLGLALVKRIIDITGCDIAVESEVGKGTVFTVSMRTGKDTPKQTEGDRL